MDLADKELIAEFVVESQEGLANVENQMLSIEAAGANIDGELVNAVFRTMHTIKGTAGFLGLDRIGALAHSLEEVLNNLRNQELIPTSELVTSVLKAADYMTGLIDAVESSNDADVEPYVSDLQRFRPGAEDTVVDVDSSEPAMNDIGPASSDAQDDLSEAECSQPVAMNSSEPEESIPGVHPISAAPASTSTTSGANETGSGERGHVATDTTIRVDVALLDKLMTRVGELVLARNQILQHTSNLEDSSFVSTAQRLNLITTELQEGVMKTRMQPIGNVWAKFPRVVRDLASQLGKQVRIEMEGKETELDKTIVEAIKDPLTHLVRNSVDHGIESPKVRVAAGKPAEGHLFLRAFHEGGQVNIEISDDGAGLNIERIRNKAVERGLISADQASRMSEREAAQLIMLPGFSTAQQVTSVSGRGVGMDVVKTNIERIGGMIDVQSRPSQGTSIKIKIPLTLAIIPALVVTSDGDRYAIPQVSLLELVRLEGEQVERDIEYVHGAPVYRLRGKLLPLLDLSEQLRRNRAESAESNMRSRDIADRVVNIVVLRANDRQFGLVVDKVNDTEEIVVKPLSRQLKNIGEYAGATIMGDGTVALILDVMGLAVASGLAGEMRDQSIASGVSGETRTGDETQSLLVVDLGDARRFALPTSMVSRLEKAPRSSIEYADGREVLQYRGAILPLVRLEHVFGGGASGDAEPDELQIVVYAEQDRSYGLVVHRIVDVVETEPRYHTKHDADDNLLGTTVIQQRVTDVLNLRNLAKHAHEARRLFAS